MLPDFVQKVSIPITKETFESILNYLISVKSVSRRFIHNILILLEKLDKGPYERDDYDKFIIDAVEFTSQLRFDGVNNLNYIKNSIEQSSLDQKYVNKIFNNLKNATSEMTKEEYINLEKCIADYVDYIYIYITRSSIVQSYSDLMNTNGKPSIESIHKLKDLFESTLSNIRMTDATRNDESDINIDPKNKNQINTRIEELYDILTDPSNNFKVGIKELNRFLKGGYKRKRCYIYYAPTNSFKSGILLYNALWIMKFNPQIKPKFPNKRLAILLLTMENSVEETMDRIYSIYTGGQFDVENLTKDQYVKQWAEINGDLFNSNFSLIIRYVSPGYTSLSIQSLVTEIEDDDNLEIAVVIIDHLGNIGKLDKHADDRSGLISSMYELSDWVKRTDRLLITAMHTNSTFDSEIAEAIANGKSNLVNMMGRHCIADAKYIDRAVDMSIYLYKEYSHYDGNFYLGFKYEKVRGKEQKTGSNVFYHRLENGITLRFDENTPSCFSFPRIPGSEAIASQLQLSSPQLQLSNNINMGMDPFGTTMPMTSLQQIMPQSMQSQINPVTKVPEIKINQQTDFNIDTAGNNVYIEPTSTDTEYDNDDFGSVLESMENIGTNNFQNIYNNTEEENTEDLSDKDFTNDDSEIFDGSSQNDEDES